MFVASRSRRTGAFPRLLALALLLGSGCARGGRGPAEETRSRSSALTIATIWDHALPESAPANEAADGPVELGVKFTADRSGTIGALSFYRVAGATAASHRLSLWSASGLLLGQAVTTTETGSGWQRAVLTTPVAIRAGDVYVASYFAADGRYGATHQGLAAGTDNPPLHAAAGIDGAGNSLNGVYSYGANGGFPTSSYSASNYWIDVELTEDAAGDPGTLAAGATIWDHGLAANAPAIEGADGPVELGVKFTADRDGTIDALGFYRMVGATAASHRLSLWSAVGALLGQAVTVSETSSGWQRAVLAAPIAIRAGQVYVASYFAADGHYGATQQGLAAGVDRAPLHASVGAPGPNDAANSLNGVYLYAPDGGFPTASYHSSNYWVDVELTTAAAPRVGTSLWPDTVQGGSEANDASAVELGLAWHADVNGRVTALRFWKTAGNTGPHVGRLWDGSSPR